MKTRFILWLAVFALAPFSNAAALKIHFLSGAKEYKSEESLKKFIPWLEKHYDVKCTASWGHDGIKELPNLDELKDADVLFVFARRMKPVEEQMKLIRAHWGKGKSIVGVRTASHAFQKADNEIFDRQVMGGNYQGHYKDEPVKVTHVLKDHPVLRGVKVFPSGKLYKAGPLAKGTTVLQQGDIGTDKQMVTWVNTWKGGRTFYTSLGVPEDFENKDFKQMLANAIYWTTRRKPDQRKSKNPKR